MKKLLLGITLLASMSSFANDLNCSLYMIDKETGRELSDETKEVLVQKGYQLTSDPDNAKFEVYFHSKMKPYNNRSYEFYQFIKGEIEGQEVVSGRTIESKYDGFWDELGDAFRYAFTNEIPLEAVDTCSDMYSNPSFEYINANE